MKTKKWFFVAAFSTFLCAVAFTCAFPQMAHAYALPPGVDTSNPIVQKGLLDVTDSPYNAPNDGVGDATSAIQAAVNDSYTYNIPVYFPAGTYKVSDTIDARVPDGADEGNIRIGITLVGDTTGASRPVIKLADNAQYFNNPANPEPHTIVTQEGTRIKPVLHFWKKKAGTAEPSSTNGWVENEQPNVNYNNVIRGIDFDLGSGNSGAVAIRHQGAEGSTIQDVHIDAAGAYAGIFNLIGSGGSITDLDVNGGKYGIYADDSQPAPLVTGLTLENQTRNAIYYAGKSPLTVVGFTISEDGGPVIKIVKNAATDATEASGNLSLVNGSLQFNSLQSTATIIQNSDRIVYLKSVFVKNAGYFIRQSLDSAEDQSIASGDRGSWSRIEEYAYNKGYTPNQVVLVDDAYKTGHTFPVSGPYYTANQTLPSDLVSRHLWPNAEKFVAFDQPGVINVKDAPYNAKGDGSTDDTTAIQNAIDDANNNGVGTVYLPKGTYIISDSLHVKANVKLFGVSHTATVIGVASTANPLVDTPMIDASAGNPTNDATATTAIANFKLELPVSQLFYAIDWIVGENSISKDIWANPVAVQSGASHKWLIIHDTGGGRWYNFLAFGNNSEANSAFRIQSIQNTSAPLLFYMFHSQHGKSMNNDPQSEIIGSSNVTLFSAKFERPTQSDTNTFESALEIDDSDNINVIGNSGVLQPLSGKQVFKISNTPNITIANMGKNNGPGTGTWYYVNDVDGTNKLPGDNGVGVLFKKGSTTIQHP